MKIPNLKNKSLDEVKRALSDHYPYSVIEEPFLLMPLRLIVAKSNFEFKIRGKKNYFKVNCILPRIWSISACLLNWGLASLVLSYLSGQWVSAWLSVLWIGPALFLTKAIFRTLYLQKFERFYEDIQRAANQ